MNIYSIFGPNINYNSSSDRRELSRNRHSPLSFLSSVFSQEINDILQESISSSTGNTNRDENPPRNQTNTSTQTTPQQNQQQVEEILFLFDPLNQSSDSQGISLNEMRDLTTLEPNENTEEEKICVICHQRIEENQIIRRLNSCSHEFHVHCIDEWLTSHSNCPICRQNIRGENEQPSSSVRRNHLYQFRYGRDRT